MFMFERIFGHKESSEEVKFKERKEPEAMQEDVSSSCGSSINIILLIRFCVWL